MLFFRICQVLTELSHTRSFNSVTGVNFACKVGTGTCTRKKPHHIIHAKNILGNDKIVIFNKNVDSISQVCINNGFNCKAYNCKKVCASLFH